jgi:hypothetical protein
MERSLEAWMTVKVHEAGAGSGEEEDGVLVSIAAPTSGKRPVWRRSCMSLETCHWPPNVNGVHNGGKSWISKNQEGRRSWNYWRN